MHRQARYGSGWRGYANPLEPMRFLDGSLDCIQRACDWVDDFSRKGEP